MEERLPSFLIELLNKQYGTDKTNEIIDGFSFKKVTTVRINNLKTNSLEVINFFNENKIEYETVSFYKDAFIILNKSAKELLSYNFLKEGKLYIQGLTSMLPPIILDPKDGEDILDMASAPGSKTSQISSMTLNKANITACEVNKIRAERLKYNLSLQGTNAYVMVIDSTKLDDFFSFDKILLDAPCSGSGTINLNFEKSYKSFNEKLYKNSQILQEKMLKKAIKMLKKGHVMVYSTCSILEGENENILKKVLGKNVEIVPIDTNLFFNLELLPTKIEGTLCVKPNKYFEGFFVALLKKVN